MKRKVLLITLIIWSFSCHKTKEFIIPEFKIESTNNFSLKVVLKWENVENATYYKILRAPYLLKDNPDSYKEVGRTESNIFEDIDVVSNTKYAYKIVACSNEVNILISNSFLGQTKVITADEAFTELGILTNGKRYDTPNAIELPSIIINVIQQNLKEQSDVVFLIDNTGSMGDDIFQVKTSLNKIISTLPPGTRLGISSYNDNNYTTDWFKFSNLDSNFDASIKFLNNLTVFGGGDTPESVYDGIFLTVEKMTWTSTKRIIIVIGDAPPQEGSKSIRSLNEVIKKCTEKGLETNLFPILIKTI